MDRPSGYTSGTDLQMVHGFESIIRDSILNFQREEYPPKVLDVNVSEKCCLDSLASTFMPSMEDTTKAP